jgi:hypothetical protein
MRSPHDFEIDEEGSGAINLLDKTEIINKQVEWFKKEFEVEINYLKSVLGDENVKISWGLINYWS